MTRISFDQLAGKTIQRAEIFLLDEGRMESDFLELTFTDGSSFILNVAPTQPKFEYSTAASEQEDMQPGMAIERKSTVEED
jgi:hypothetical protein